MFSVEVDESLLLDWLKVNVGDHEQSQEVLNRLNARVVKVNAMINELRAMGHELNDDDLVDVNFFAED